MRLLYPKKNNEAYDAFIFSPANKDAYNWLDIWPQKMGDIFCTYVFGPAKCGKKHLAKLWCAQNQGTFIKEVSDHVMQIENKNMVYDIQAMESEENLFHFYNAARENKSHVLFLGNKPLNEVSIKLPDLRSRLQTAHQIEIYQPDEELMLALYKKKFDEVGVLINEEVLSFLSIRLERCYVVIDDTVKKLEEKSSEYQHALTIPFVKKVLAL